MRSPRTPSTRPALPASFHWALWLTVLTVLVGTVGGPLLLIVLPFLAWSWIKAAQGYRQILGAPQGGFGFTAENAYRHPHGRIPAVPTRGLKRFAEELLVTNTRLLDDLNRVAAMDVLTREQAARDAQAFRDQALREAQATQARAEHDAQQIRAEASRDAATVREQAAHDATATRNSITAEAETERAEVLRQAAAARAEAEIVREQADREAAVTRAEAIQQASQTREQAERDVQPLRTELQNLREQIVQVRPIAEVHSVGYYDFEHPAEASMKLSNQLEEVRRKIKASITGKTAVRTVTNFTFNNSAKEGMKFVNDLSKLLLRAYNAEAENCVKTTKAGNYHVAQNRLQKAREQIRKAGTMIGLDVTESFHDLRCQEILLAAQHLQAVAAAKEEERDRREAAREAAKALKELEAAKAKQQKAVDHHHNVLAKLEEAGDEEAVVRVREQLAEAEAALQDVDNRLANTRAGYVYVISNLGSFGERVVKIGMTRRLDPMDRVKELGDASVPFNFDVHALFFSQDAVDIETTLHRHFAAQRVNRVNLRREYFYATPEEVRDALAAHDVELVEFQLDAEADEFRVSEELRTSGTSDLAPVGP
ncbi:DUF4041 domain-containing protein [Kocuria rosea]|uniref:DUF4041 domain-containing protein n=1 Tax=Kocuria rosea TaxID=1275 RepID=UPI0025412DB3|nr:DUF4041 domain-containing protein [Kocuria rosea]WIG19369.1 DUF4041 domain-containing protein [Kocuria rosea]